jgi:hypothetical protein
MTEEQIKRQIEIIEKGGEEICKSRESAMKFLEEWEKEMGMYFNEERARAARLKKKKNARLSAV